MTTRTNPTALAARSLVGASIGLAALTAMGCGVPFGVTRSASIVLPLGAADPACSTTSESRTVAGRAVTFDRHLADEATVDGTGAPTQGCELSSTATGTFIDLASAKKQAGSAADGTHIDDVTIDVSAVHLENVDLNAVHSLHASVAIGGQPDVIVVDGVPPNGTSHVSEALVKALDAAWQTGADVDGNGNADLVEDAGLTGAPALAIDLQIHVQGTASLGG